MTDTNQLRRTLVCLVLLQLMAALDQTVIATALPSIGGQLGHTEHLSWVVSAYLLAATSFTPISGRLSDYFGRKPVFITSASLFLISSVLCGFADNILWLILARFVQGAGGGGLTASGHVIMADLAPGQSRGRCQGLLGASYGFGSSIGPMAGGFITDHVGWRWIFYLNLPLGLCAMLFLVGVTIQKRCAGSAFPDPISTALLIAWTSSFVLAANQFGLARSRGMSLAWLLIGVGCLCLFIWRARRTTPIILLGLLKQRSFSAITATSFLIGAPLVGGLVFLSIFLQVIRGRSASSSSIELSTLMLGLVVSSIISGLLTAKGISPRRISIVGCCLLMIGFVLLSNANQTTNEALFLGEIITVGVGAGSVIQLLVVMGQSVGKRNEWGSVTSLIIFARSLGGSLGTAVFGGLLQNRLASVTIPPGSNLSSAEIERAILSGSDITDVKAIALNNCLIGLHDVFLVATAFAAAAMISVILAGSSVDGSQINK